MRGEIKLKLDIMKTSLDGIFIRFLELLMFELFDSAANHLAEG